MGYVDIFAKAVALPDDEVVELRNALNKGF